MLMSGTKKTICLVMIVRNESRIIKRCLDRVKDHIDYWVIVDTGSDDNTKEIILDTLSNVPGELHEQEWVNFGYNRTQSLKLAKNKADYILLCDADEQIIFSDEFDASTLDKDCYLIHYVGGSDYSVPYLFRGNMDWYYEGVTHEYLDSDEPYVRHKLSTISILDLHDGGFKHDKFERDIRLLEQGLIDEPNNSRYKFYLANSYRDVDNYEKAAEWYSKRIEDGGWREEVTCSYEYLGQAYLDMGQRDKALVTWLKGYDFNPSRMECLYNAAKLLRWDNNCRLAYQLGYLAEKIDYPENDILFIKKRVYEFWIYYELSISSYYVGDFQTGYNCCKKVLFNNPDFSPLKDTVSNLRFYKGFAERDSIENVQKLIVIIEDYLTQVESDEEAEFTLEYLRTLVK